MKQIERIANVGAKIGADQEKERAATLDAMRDTLDAVFEDEENAKRPLRRLRAQPPPPAPAASQSARPARSPSQAQSKDGYPE
ncbi:hypothetical protein [Pontivivens ytuae]|uniref:Uncharacterized protein n=1 Tax=Pontivivens ytuae TaxID=2789856 RepID=A0A7S9QDC7_9RHOB|nr:hypothetical protein [Pontivivens ytuae]QPH54247.1 hypothetical protein I0K15_00265 [Pontivivens ytuae]